LILACFDLIYYHCAHRYRPVSAAVFRRRWAAAEHYYDNALLNHNNDPTGAQGEERPIWFAEMQRFYQWKENQLNRNRTQQVHRDDMQNVQQELGAVQAPLGPGNPPLRSEIAAQNPTQQEGPHELADTVQIAQVAEQNPRRRTLSPVPNAGTAAANGNTGSSRSNRRRVEGRTIQDQIDEGRTNLNQIVSLIGDMRDTVAPRNNPPPPPRPFQEDPIGSLRSIQENMMAIATNLGPSEVHDTNVRSYHAWHQLMGVHAQANNMQIPAAPALPPDDYHSANHGNIHRGMEENDDELFPDD
jgi:hypothetical protein